MKHRFVDTVWQRKCSLHNGLEKLPRPEKVRLVRSNVKVMFTVSFDIKGVVHYEFLRQGQTVNRWHYLEVLKRRRENVRRKSSHLWRNNS
jgi:hypothetical protein